MLRDSSVLIQSCQYVFRCMHCEVTHCVMLLLLLLRLIAWQLICTCSGPCTFAPATPNCLRSCGGVSMSC